MDKTFLKGIFWVVGMCLAAMLLYQVFFVGENSALRTACRAVETPISRSYYETALYPSAHSSEGVANALGYGVSNGVTDFSVNDTDTASTAADYSTGWR